MKLYTEEQVKKAIKMALDGFCIHGTEDTIEVVASKFTPIELPSDEEIMKDSKYKSLAGIGWIEGAKWMRDKIQGGIK